MTTLRQFTCDDLFKFSTINLDALTEVYGLGFYLQYMARWPEYFMATEAPNGDLMGYIMGKSEGVGENWHGHVTCVTVGPDHRCLGLGKRLMEGLEVVSEKKKCYFVDLFVRASNKKAIEIYEKMGYVVYRIVLEYYSGENEENAYDMRKAMSRDRLKKSMIPLVEPVRIDDLEF